MSGDRYLLCDLTEKPNLEVRNGLAQLDFLDHLINTRQIAEIRTSHVRELKCIAIENIYPCGDTYRDAFRRVYIEGSRHRLPHESLVPSLVDEMVDKLNQEHPVRTAVERAAYAIWRTNWIHPFAGGNGRTARALGYLVLCMDLGRVPGGEPQFPTIIYDAAEAYTQALRHADATVDWRGEADLEPMIELVDDAIFQQLRSFVGDSEPPD